ncbi:hypothetical protein VFPPC_18654 [Pochonia chlamydosporia 170]|uniref:Uncharacterized protein n=1 Tax=Pochonia chlamydosporia 170 TaxID=1380566 RepID=A0A219AMR2_METCM|nr:hypothetical protein VFPPC_18654 [Pochonia chlamydosporia 170]OWT42228.1 hypothetical protein VFPPC_18654 [Pochonia chlamydosporia 170]
MHRSDDVLYICTNPRAGGSTGPATTTSTSSTASMIHHGSVGRAWHKSCPQTSETPPILNSTHSRGRRLEPKSRLVVPGGLTVPHEIKNKCVRLGWAPKDGKGKRPAVFGIFSAAGRFCRRMGYESPSSRPIAHAKIEYLGRFRGMSSGQVRDEVLQLLILRSGPILDSGEI